MNEKEFKKAQCNYTHSSNPFNMEHKVQGIIKAQKDRFNISLDFASPLWDIKSASTVNFKFCSKTFKGKGKKLQHVFAQGFSKQFNGINKKDMKLQQENKNECIVFVKKDSRKLREIKKIRQRHHYRSLI